MEIDLRMWFPPEVEYNPSSVILSVSIPFGNRYGTACGSKRVLRTTLPARYRERFCNAAAARLVELFTAKS